MKINIQEERKKVEDILKFTPTMQHSKLAVARDKKGQISEISKRLLNAIKEEKRDVNEEEARFFDEMLQQMDTLSNEATELQGQRDAEIDKFILKENRVKGNIQKTEWRDASGNPVHVLSKEERVASLQAEALSLGKVVRGLVTSDWSNADKEMRALSTAAGSAGVMVPSTVAANVIDMARANSAFIQAGAKTLPMGSGTVTIARVDADPVMEVKAENAKFLGSNIGFGGVTLTAQTIGCVVFLSQELMQDSVNGADAIETAIAGALAAEIDKLGLIGTGTGQPKGILNADGVQAIPTIGILTNYAKFVEAWVKVLTANGVSNGYIVSPAQAGTLETLTASDGQYLLPPPSIAALPRYITSAVPAGTAFFGNFATAILGVRDGLRIEVSTEAGEAFERHQVAVKITARIDFGFERPAHLVKMTGITG